MTHADFIIPAYVLTVAGLFGLLAVSWVRMRAAERAAAELRERRR